MSVGNVIQDLDGMGIGVVGLKCCVNDRMGRDTDSPFLLSWIFEQWEIVTVCKIIGLMWYRSWRQVSAMVEAEKEFGIF